MISHTLLALLFLASPQEEPSKKDILLEELEAKYRGLRHFFAEYTIYKTQEGKGIPKKFKVSLYANMDQNKLLAIHHFPLEKGTRKVLFVEFNDNVIYRWGTGSKPTFYDFKPLISRIKTQVSELSGELSELLSQGDKKAEPAKHNGFTLAIQLCPTDPRTGQGTFSIQIVNGRSGANWFKEIRHATVVGIQQKQDQIVFRLKAKRMTKTIAISKESGLVISMILDEGNGTQRTVELLDWSRLPQFPKLDKPRHFRPAAGSTINLESLIRQEYGPLTSMLARIIQSGDEALTIANERRLKTLCTQWGRNVTYAWEAYYLQNWIRGNLAAAVDEGYSFDQFRINMAGTKAYFEKSFQPYVELGEKFIARKIGASIEDIQEDLRGRLQSGTDRERMKALFPKLFDQRVILAERKPEDRPELGKIVEEELKLNWEP